MAEIETHQMVEFAPHFRSCTIRPDGTDSRMRAALGLRFQIYCEECAFLPASDYPDKLESDGFDAGAAHFGAVNLTDQLVGYVRLVRPNAQAAFPFQQHCAQLHAGVALPEASLAGEISRLMVRNDYRRRRGDILAGVTTGDGAIAPDHERRDNSPQILLSLYRSMYQFSVANGVRYWYAAMERSLARALTRMNFTFVQIGPQTDYYGPVAPYVADLRELEARIGDCNPPLLAWMQGVDVRGN